MTAWIVVGVVLVGLVTWMVPVGETPQRPVWPWTPRWALGVWAALALVTVWAYASVWTAGWAYDDPVWAPVLSGWSIWRVATLIGKGQPWAYHGLVMCVHLVNGVLLYVVSRRYLSVPGTIVAVGIFWLHPLQTEAVAYVSGGIEVILTTLVLTAILMGRIGGIIGAGLGLIALGLAVRMKPSALPLLVVVPVVWWRDAGIAMIWRTGPILLGLVASAAVTWEWLLVRAADVHTRIAGFGRVIGATGRLLLYTIWPARFSLEHDWSRFGGALAPMLIVSAALLVALALWTLRTAAAPMGWAILWTFALTLPRAVIPNTPPLLEHHTYLVFVSVWMLAGLAWDRVSCSLSQPSVSQ